MLVPDSQACGNQFSSTTPLSAAQLAAIGNPLLAVDAAVADAQHNADALLVANPWEDWRGGFNLMKDIQRGNTQAGGAPLTAGSGGPGSQLPGLPPAGEGRGYGAGSLWDRFKRNLSGDRGRGRRGTLGAGGRSGNARSADQVQGWDSRFVTGPGGKFATWPPAGEPGRGGGISPGHGWRRVQGGWRKDITGEFLADAGGGRGGSRRGPGGGAGYGGDARPGNCGEVDCFGSDVVDCISEPANVAPSDGISPSGVQVTTVSIPPPNPPLRTDQPVNVIVPPPVQYQPQPVAPITPAPVAPPVSAAGGCVVPPPSGNICLDIKRGTVHQSRVSPEVLYRCSQLGYAGVPPCSPLGPPISVAPADLAAIPQYNAGMGMWTPSLAQPGAVPADCATMRAAASRVPWWLWALGGVALLAVVTDETKTRRASATRQKRAA